MNTAPEVPCKNRRSDGTCALGWPNGRIGYERGEMPCRFGPGFSVAFVECADYECEQDDEQAGEGVR